MYGRRCAFPGFPCQFRLRDSSCSAKAIAAHPDLMTDPGPKLVTDLPETRDRENTQYFPVLNNIDKKCRFLDKQALDVEISKLYVSTRSTTKQHQ